MYENTIETTTISTTAGDYRLELHTDQDVEEPNHSGFVLVTYGAPHYVNIEHGEDDLIGEVQQALSNSYYGTEGYGSMDNVSGAAIVRWLRLQGRRGVTLVHQDYMPDDASTDRRDRVYGVAWAEDHIDAADVDNVVRYGLETYRAWANGEGFGWTLIDPDEEEVESVWGYYDTPGEREYVLSQAREIAADDAKRRSA